MKPHPEFPAFRHRVFAAIGVAFIAVVWAKVIYDIYKKVFPT